MSTKVVQLDLFRQEREAAEEAFREMTKKSIKGLFARHNDLEFVVFEMHKLLDKLCDDFYKPEKKDLEFTL